MRHKADVRAQNRGSGAGLVVVHLQVPLLAGELFTAVSDVGWLCDWHTNSGPVSQESSGSGVLRIVHVLLMHTDFWSSSERMTQS
jgi:hypothetical protein